MSGDELPETEIEAINPSTNLDATWFIETDLLHFRKGCLIFCKVSPKGVNHIYFWDTESSKWQYFGSDMVYASWNKITEMVQTKEGRGLLRMLYPYVVEADLGGNGNDW